ncbi:beta-lactamase [Fonsecaea pedrosoi]|nr:beta-lactamase [Fonsecaea pedrosoi]
MAILWHHKLALIISLHTTLLLAQLQCPPLGPILPAPTNLTHNNNNNSTLSQVLAAITTQLQAYSSQLNATALSVGVRSIHEPVPVLSFHHTPTTLNTSGTHKVDGDTVYAIGSATKLFTALSILQLQGKINLADPITKYVPRLAQMDGSHDDPLTTVDWDSVTVDALASHLGGIGADLTNSVIPYRPGITDETGLPPLTPSQNSLSCSGAPGTSGCSWNDFFNNFARRPPVYAPSTTPVYSNIGYALLGRVIENVTGKTYAAYLEDAVFGPANLRRTSLGAPANTSLGFIPAETNWWGTPLGYENSSGGIYSTNNDLLSFGAAILSSKLLASPAKTRAWLKPKTFTSSPGVSVGAPWEIARGENLTADGRLIDLYTKTGNLGDYTAILALVPDYDLVVAINLAGPESSIAAIQVIFSMLVQALVPGVAEVGRSDAELKYAGTYTSSSSSSAGSNANATSTITLSVDDYGLVVSDFVARGIDVRSPDTGYAALAGSSDNTTTTIRLYPTNLAAGNQTAWRAVYQTSSAAELAAFDAELFFPGGSCQSWTAVDLQTYGFEALDYFVLTADSDGVVVRVEPRAWRLVMDRTATSGR